MEAKCVAKKVERFMSRWVWQAGAFPVVTLLCVVGVPRRVSSKKKLSDFSPLSHELVPKHEIVPVEEAKALLEKYGVAPTQLPAILESDPVAIELGAKVGEVIKITRDSRTSGTAVYYRVVVRG